MLRGKIRGLSSGMLLGLLVLVNLGGWGWVGTEQALAKAKVPYKIADLTAVLWPTPNIFVRSGEILSYEVHLKNYGTGKASHVYVQIPFNPNHVTPLEWALAGKMSKLSIRGMRKNPTPQSIALTSIPNGSAERMPLL